MEKRLVWATETVDRDWSNVLFSDEASFWAWVPIKRSWSAAGERFKAQKMLQIYEHGLLRSAEKMFGANNKDWILQEDNDPKHRSQLCTSRRVENGITTLDWPSQSPDANAIENVWSVVKRKLAGKRAITLEQFSRRIKELWRSLLTEYAEKLVESMPRRCKAIIQNKGDWTVY